MSESSKIHDRTLFVFETIARQGPISLNDLAVQTKIPRSAVHRAAQTLQIQGWIRPRLNDHAYEVSAKFDDMMGLGHFASPDVEKHTRLLQGLSQLGLFGDLGMFRRRGSFETIETTDRKASVGDAHSLVRSKFAIVALRQMSAISRVRHLEAYLTEADEKEALVITSGKMAGLLNMAPADHISATGNGVIIPMDNEQNQGLTLRIRRKPSRGKAILADLINETRTTKEALEFLDHRI